MLLNCHIETFVLVTGICVVSSSEYKYKCPSHRHKLKSDDHWKVSKLHQVLAYHLYALSVVPNIYIVAANIYVRSIRHFKYVNVWPTLLWFRTTNRNCHYERKQVVHYLCYDVSIKLAISFEPLFFKQVLCCILGKCCRSVFDQLNRSPYDFITRKKSFSWYMSIRGQEKQWKKKSNPNADSMKRD